MAKKEFTLDLVSCVRVGKNPRGAFVLCIEVQKNIYVVVKSLLQYIVGQNKRLSLRGERAVIRDNISQNWWIYYRVTKFTANVNHISSLEAWTSALQMSEWFIFVFLSPVPSLSVSHLPCEDSSCDHQFLAWPGCHKTVHSELTTSRLLWVTATAELKMVWRRCLTPRASRFLRTTLASAVTPRTCDGLTLTTGDMGGKMWPAT